MITGIQVAIAHALMASLAMFPTVFETYESRYRRFHSKKSSLETIQGVIVFVI